MAPTFQLRSGRWWMWPSANGEPLVPANMDGTPRNSDQGLSDASGPPAAAGPRQYKAQAGDTVSRMAAKLLGANSRANRQAIINANPSLAGGSGQSDRRRQPTLIPAAAQTAMAPSPSNATPTPSSIERTRPTGKEYFYTVQEGDSLWQIANDELGDPSAVDAIKELNQSVLKGKDHETVIPGMKLRLPSKPVASANLNVTCSSSSCA